MLIFLEFFEVKSKSSDLNNLQLSKTKITSPLTDNCLIQTNKDKHIPVELTQTNDSSNKIIKSSSSKGK